MYINFSHGSYDVKEGDKVASFDTYTEAEEFIERNEAKK